MASKIFMGDMPELMEIILNNLNLEYYSLYSCALVSRHWCKMSIPILWQDPFSNERRPSYISKYFSSLSEDEKSVLKECGIDVEISKTLFDYARFLKFLNLSRLQINVGKWINIINITFANSKPYPDGSSINRIVNLLLKLFIESGATLHEFDLYYHSELFDFRPEIYYSLEQNDSFFSRLQHLSLEVLSGLNIEGATTLLSILAKNATKISSLKLDVYSDYESKILHAVKCIIKSQEQLKQFTLAGGDFPTKKFHGIISALECQNKTLQEVIIEYCECNSEFKVLMNCKNLEVLRIKDSYNMKVLEASLNTLEITKYKICASSITQILEKSGSLLQRLKLESTDEGTGEIPLLLQTLKTFCPNITYLSIEDVEISSQFLELIGNLQKLQFLTLSYIVDIDYNEQKKRIVQFAEILPLALQYLDLKHSFLDSYIDILLNNCNAPLKNLIIDRLDDEKKAKALINFCKRNKSLNYVGVNRYLDLDDNIKKDVDVYITLVSYKHIVINC